MTTAEQSGYYGAMRRTLITLLSLCLLTPAAHAYTLPDLGDASASVMSPAMEQRIGEAAMRDIRQDPQYNDDAEITLYLNQLASRLVAHSLDPSQKLTLFLINDPTLNAFAMPGGFIGVNTGLITATDNESQLASVLGHEIGHVVLHHAAQSMAAARTTVFPTLAALALALAASRGNANVAGAAIAASTAHIGQADIDMTRLHEQEADRVGFQTLVAAGFDGHAMPAFFGKMARMAQMQENTLPAFLRDHPMSTDRQADLDNRAAKLPYRQVPDSLDYLLVRAKLQVESQDPREAIKMFSASLGSHSYGVEAAQRYGLAVAFARNHQPERARQELAQIKIRHPFIDSLAARMATEAGHTDQAFKDYRQALARWPHHPTLTLGYTRLLILNGQSRAALPLLDYQLAQYPKDAHLYLLKAQAEAELGNDPEQHRAQAEAYFYQGNVKGAIEQLQIGRRAAHDFYTTASIDARLKQLRDIEADLKKNPLP